MIMDSETTEAVSETVAASRNPGSEWRGAPFWALNGELEPEELRRQIRGFRALGLGGFFLHARTGLQTPYLSERWFECIGAAIDEAGKLGMQAWLYDEDRFPSGSGGGFVTADPRWRAKGIFLQETMAFEADTAPLPEGTLAVFAAVIDGDRARGVRRLPERAPFGVNAGETRLAFYPDTMMCNSWYNNYTYLDTLNPDAVAQFIALTHEAYQQRFADQFGSVVPGIFTDEPRYGFLLNLPEWENDRRYALPWTPGLLEEFQDTFGYDPVVRLPELFFEVEDTDSVAPRVHYIEMLTRLFLRAYAQPTGSWCDRHGLVFTGHVVAEDSLSYQTRCVGSAMRFYEYMGMPGMDLLTEHHRAYQTAKQVASAARQFGRKRRLTESYGCTGWDFPIAGFKALGDWQFALGINFRCQHLAFYTMEGEAKRDYPCTVALHSNAPENFRAMEDYFARLSVYLSGGVEQRSILVVSPIESAWALLHRNWCGEAATLDFDRAFTALSHTLLAHQLDFDYGDEDILARHGRVTEVDGRPALQVGCAEYRAVVLPRMVTLRRSTLELLQRFQAAGGRVTALTPFPQHLDGWPAEQLELPFIPVACHRELPKLLEEFRTVAITQEGGEDCRSLLYQLRCCGDYDLVFVCNTGHAVDDGEENGATYEEPGVLERREVYPAVRLRAATAHAGEVVEFDPATGGYRHCDAERTADGWEIATGFGRLETRLFLFAARPGMFPAEALPAAPAETRKHAAVAPERWQVRLSEPNVAVFDHFTSFLSDTPEFVLALDDRLRRHFDLPERNFMMVQPWCRPVVEAVEHEVELHVDFRCEALPAGEVFLVLEHPEFYHIFVNGAAVPIAGAGYWHEPAWRKCRVPTSRLRSGANRITLSTRFGNRHPGLESAFLIGDFGVRLEGDEVVLTAPVRELAPGDWGPQGLPFYPGGVSYETLVTLPEACRGTVAVPEFLGTPARVRIDGGDAHDLLFSPGETEEIMLPACFRLSVTISGSMRNACGPFFQAEQPVWSGPGQFKSVQVRERQFRPYGLYSGVCVRV